MSKTKDVTKIEASVSRGGLLLSDYTNILSTTKCAVDVREAFRAAELPEDFPIVTRVRATVTQAAARPTSVRTTHGWPHRH